MSTGNPLIAAGAAGHEPEDRSSGKLVRVDQPALSASKAPTKKKGDSMTEPP